MRIIRKAKQTGNRRFSKVICIGWHKTGTTTMGDALLQLGYRVLGARVDTGDLLLRGEVELVLKMADPFDAVQDVPWALLYREFDQRESNCAFILTIRDEEQWLKSAIRHFEGSAYNRPIFDWMYGAGQIDGNEALFLDRYRTHNREVRKYFAGRDDLLIMDLSRGDGWNELCAFLGHDVPSRRFPHSNPAPEKWDLVMRMRNAIKKMLPGKSIQAISSLKASIRGLLGLPDIRDRFNNRAANKAVREALEGRSADTSQVCEGTEGEGDQTASLPGKRNG